jgi:hypothetical protein
MKQATSPDDTVRLATDFGQAQASTAALVEGARPVARRRQPEAAVAS